jgi:hypothetical protein
MIGNSRKAAFLASFPEASIESSDDTLTQRCKFNFSYFVKQDTSQSFDEWSYGQLVKLMEKLKEYSYQPLSYWTNQSVGKSGRILSIYGAFPKDSDMEHPKHVPHQVLWGRFRLEQSVRLVGFVLPPDLHHKAHSSGDRFDCNTFYVVFLDANHAFYKSGEKSEFG